MPRSDWGLEAESTDACGGLTWAEPFITSVSTECRGLTLFGHVPPTTAAARRSVASTSTTPVATLRCGAPLCGLSGARGATPWRVVVGAVVIPASELSTRPLRDIGRCDTVGCTAAETGRADTGRVDAGR